MSTHPHTPLSVESQTFQSLEHCTVVLSDKSSSVDSANKVQRKLFFQRNSTMENIPLTQLLFMTVVVYDCCFFMTSSVDSVNEVQRKLFFERNNTMENIPLT